LDGGKTSIEFLDFEGAYLSSIHLDRMIFGGFRIGDGEFLVSGLLGSSGGHVKIAEGLEPVSLDLPELVALPEEEDVQCASLFSWDRGVARLRMTTPEIEVFDLQGDLARKVHVNLPVEPVSEAEREEALARVRDLLAGSGLPLEVQRSQVAAMEERFKIKCKFQHPDVDSSQSLLAFMEQNPEDFGSGNTVLHFLTQDGVYLAKVEVPSTWRDFSIEEGVVYALAPDPVSGLVSLKAYRVDLPRGSFREASEVLGAAR